MKRAIAILVLLALGGCGLTEGPEQTEDAEVVQLAYVPGTSGSGTGFSTSGNVSFVSVSSSEVWATVLRCEKHGKTFSLRGKDIYDKCKVGQKVKLIYVDLIDDQGVVQDQHTKRVEAK